MEYPILIEQALYQMSRGELQAFQDYMRRKSKSEGIGYLLWFLLGFHYAYVGKWGIQLLFWLTCGGFFMWYLIDLFRVPSIIKEYNEQIMVDAIHEIRSIYALMEE